MNSSDAGYLRKGDLEELGPSTEVVAQQATTFRGVKCCGMWWPEDAWVRRFKKTFPENRLHLYHGRRGLVEDPSLGEAIGCVRLEEIDSESALKSTTLASSATDFGTGQVDANFAAVRKRVSGVVAVVFAVLV